MVVRFLYLNVGLTLLGAALLAAALFLGGCASPRVTPEREVDTVTITVPVPVKCDVDRPTLDGYPDTEAALLAAKDIFQQVKLLMAARRVRFSNEAKLWAYGDGCSGKAPAK